MGIFSSSNNLIGTDGDAVNDQWEGNVIAASSQGGGVGVSIQSFGAGDPTPENNVISGNKIGTDVTGTVALANEFGILDGGLRTIIGTDGTGDSTAKRNLISGNTRGIQSGAESTIAGNYIGVNADGDAILPNGTGIVDVVGSVIGTNGDGIGDEFEGNVIAGNDAIFLGGVADNVIAGNLIGLNANGSEVFANDGIRLFYGPSNNLIGTNSDGVSDELERNVIAATGSAIRFHDGANGNIVAGNYIGTDKSGMSFLGGTINTQDGAVANVIGTNGDGIGDEVEGNVIGGIIQLANSTTFDNVIAGNFVGVAADGVTYLGGGIPISGGASGNRVGTNGDGVSDDLERNVLGWVNISDPGSDNNVIAGNYIGVAADGQTSLGVVGDGLVFVYGGASDNRIGTNADGVHDASERNVIAGASGVGVFIYQNSPDIVSGNVVAGNFIGVAADGTTPVPNGGHGVLILVGAGNTIGGVAPAAGNVIAHSGWSGVGVAGAEASGNAILGNSIHSNDLLGIALEVDEVIPNDPGDADTGGNDLQNFPVLASAGSLGTSVQVVGSLQRTPNESFRIEFFANTALDPTGHGEGETYLGFADATTDSSGDALFNVTLSAAVPVGYFITATATNAAGSTSEFSLGLDVVPGAPLAQAIDVDLRSTNLNIDQGGALSLVLYGSSAFNTTQVLVESLKFAGVSIDAFNRTFSDVNQDGSTDVTIHFRVTAALKVALTQIYSELLLEDYADDQEYDFKQDALVAVDGVFGELGEQFQGYASAKLFLAGKSLRSLLESLDI